MTAALLQEVGFDIVSFWPPTGGRLLLGILIVLALAVFAVLAVKTLNRR